ncbi:MAG TPA: glycoside hydrolase family 2 TIM barrel-domain containing protein [Opitutaceae bacterium]|nr:glycoside hydrolase family 2 TIM barrel-domain containing protein [Opitutaceae bacterium]
MPLDTDWLFGGRLSDASTAADFNDGGFTRVTLPHCVTKLSWRDWDPSSWEQQWIYRRHFNLPASARAGRVFVAFDGVMVGATPVINGHALPTHLGGYLPFRHELTEHLREGDNVLAVAVDSRWSNVPPEGAPVGPKRIDYLEPGGIHRGVRLEIVPPIAIADVFAKPINVLEANRRIDVACTLDAGVALPAGTRLVAELRDGSRILAHAERAVDPAGPGPVAAGLTLSDLGNVALWDVDRPQLYDLVTTLVIAGQPVHDHRVRLGLRDARFELDGFHLNGRRLQLFGLNRHELYPYVGAAMPARVMRRDAEILRREFACNIVRCSHYPQSEAFLDACDEQGLLVWEEVPGWGYIGDAAWQKLLLRDVRDMITRDRNHPSIVIWGTRVNESPNEEELYHQTRAIAKSLDDSRPTSGTMTSGSRKTWQTKWHEDVFAYDDYHAEPDGTVGIEPPVPGHPYLLAEAVGQFNYAARKGFNSIYRRGGDVATQQLQALRHAQAHSRAAVNPRICGVIAWCAFEYGSLVNPWHNVKCPGVADVFRIPKLGAAFYRAQVDPAVRPVIEPNFYWDFGAQTPRGPGKHAAIFSNCDRLEVFVAGVHHASLTPDRTDYPHVRHAPSFVDLELDGSGHPELRIDGYVGGRRVASRTFSSDPTRDQFVVTADDPALRGDGSDATRIVFRVADAFGANRAFGAGTVTFELAGPAELVGDNPFVLDDAGGAGAVWVRSQASGSGDVILTAHHVRLGATTLHLKIEPAINA